MFNVTGRGWRGQDTPGHVLVAGSILSPGRSPRLGCKETAGSLCSTTCGRQHCPRESPLLLSPPAPQTNLALPAGT